MTCPSFDELLAARSAPGAHVALVEHVGHCAECARTWNAAGLLLDAPAAAAWRDVPDALTRAARDLARRARPARPAAAQLRTDSSTGARPAVALRGAGPAARHLQYESGPLHLELAVVGGGTHEGDTLVGLLAGARDPALATCVLAGASNVRWTPLESNGDFRFDRVAPGHYLLLADADGESLLVPDLDLSAPSAPDPLR